MDPKQICRICGDNWTEEEIELDVPHGHIKPSDCKATGDDGLCDTCRNA